MWGEVKFSIYLNRRVFVMLTQPVFNVQYYKIFVSSHHLATRAQLFKTNDVVS